MTPSDNTYLTACAEPELRSPINSKPETENFSGFPDQIYFYYAPGYLVFFLTLSVIVFRQVIFSARINTESVCAALSGFLLIGYMGFFMFSAIENHMPGAFRGLSRDELQMMNELFYYSFISILTVGYGDIVAVSWPARNATILVILTGYIYSLVFIARIVSGFSVSDK